VKTSRFFRGALFGLLLSFPSISIFAHAAVDAGSVVVGALMLGLTGALIAIGDWRVWRSPNACDALFGILCLSVAASTLANGLGADRKEFIIFVLSLAAYPAARMNSDLSARWLTATLAVIVVLGTLVTIPALISQWDSAQGKPVVLGYDASPTIFAAVLGLLLLAVVSRPLTLRRAVTIAAGASIPVLVFAACMVRFSFIAIAATLALAAVTYKSEQRKAVAIILAAVIVSVVAGASSRSSLAERLTMYAAMAFGIKLDTPPPPPAPNQIACDGRLDLRNSIAIRKQLYLDAFSLAHKSGPLGVGLNRFMDFSCVTDTEIHNSFLQAWVEFGWLAGFSFAILVLVAGGWSRALVRVSPEVRLSFFCLAFVTLLTMAHGRISRDQSLFLLLGYAASLKSERRKIAREFLLGPFEPGKPTPWGGTDGVFRMFAEGSGAPPHTVLTECHGARTASGTGCACSPVGNEHLAPVRS
jgi:hypothetical protein